MGADMFDAPSAIAGDIIFEVLASVPLVIEYEAVLTRQEHLDASGLTAPQMNEVLDALVKVSIPATLRFMWRPQLKDPADEMVLETAVNGGADWLVTFNLRHLAAAARRFGIQVGRPCDVWREFRRYANSKRRAAFPKPKEWR
jgi:predicted nucleic acid-binding protein